jgi:tetratricopeptide (TPR) repeat protein
MAGGSKAWIGLVFLPFVCLLSLFAFATIAYAMVSAARLVRASARGARALQRREYEEAERCLRASLGLSGRIYGTNHPVTRKYLATLALAVASQKRLEEALGLVVRATSGCPPAGPASRVALADVFVLGAAVAATAGDPKQQLEMLRQAQSYRQRLGPTATVAIDTAMARLLRQLGDREGADRLLEGKHMARPELAKLGRSRLEAGDPEGAVRAFERAIASDQNGDKVTGNLALLYSLLAEAHARRGSNEQARLALLSAVQTYEGLSAIPFVVAPLLVRLARAEAACGNAAAAEATCREALRLAAPPRTSESERRGADPYRDRTEADPLAPVREEAEHFLRSVGALRTLGDDAM